VRERTHSRDEKSCAEGEPWGKRAPNEPARQEMGDPRKWRVYEAGLKLSVEYEPIV